MQLLYELLPIWLKIYFEVPIYILHKLIWDKPVNDPISLGIEPLKVFCSVEQDVGKTSEQHLKSGKELIGVWSFFSIYQ